MHSLNNVGNITDINVFFLDGIHFHIDVGFIILNKIKKQAFIKLVLLSNGFLQIATQR